MNWVIEVSQHLWCPDREWFFEHLLNSCFLVIPMTKSIFYHHKDSVLIFDKPNISFKEFAFKKNRHSWQTKRSGERSGISSKVLISKDKLWNQLIFIEIPSLPSRTNHRCEGMTVSLKLKAISLIFHWLI